MASELAVFGSPSGSDSVSLLHVKESRGGRSTPSMTSVMAQLEAQANQPPPQPIDIWQTIFYGLAFTSAVSTIVSTLVNEEELMGKAPGLVLLAFFSIYLPCFFQYMLQVAFLAMPRTHEPLREVVPYVWELLNVALMCMGAANVPSCTEVFLFKRDDENDYNFEQCSHFSFIMFGLRLLTALAYFLYRFTHNLSKVEQFNPVMSRKGNTAYLVTRGLAILLIGLFWLFNAVLQLYHVYGKTSFILTWWSVLIADVFIVHLGLVTQFVQRLFGKCPLFNLPDMMSTFNLFFGSVLASYIIYATFFSPTHFSNYLISLMVVSVAFVLAPSYNANSLLEWFREHTKKDLRLRIVGSLWGLSHIILFAAVIISGTFYNIAMNRDLSTTERWYLCVSYVAILASLTALSQSDILSLFDTAHGFMKFGLRYPERVTYMGQPLKEFMRLDELQQLRMKDISEWSVFFLSLFLRIGTMVLILLLPIFPPETMPVWLLFLLLLVLTLVDILVSPLYIAFLFSLCSRNSSKLHLKWLYAIKYDKLAITPFNPVLHTFATNQRSVFHDDSDEDEEAD